jgi:hypothetical protein
MMVTHGVSHVVYSCRYSDLSGFTDFSQMFLFFLLNFVGFNKGFLKFRQRDSLGRIIRVIV